MIRSLNDIAGKRGQSLAQMAISWVLRDQGDRTLTSALLGASSVEQLEHNLGARWITLTSARRSWLRLTTSPMTPASTAGPAPPPPACEETRRVESRP